MHCLGVLIDVRNKVKDDKYRLSVNDIKEWEAVHGPIPKGNVVLINFGWGARFYPNRQAFLGSIYKTYQMELINFYRMQTCIHTSYALLVIINYKYRIIISHEYHEK